MAKTNGKEKTHLTNFLSLRVMVIKSIISALLICCSSISWSQNHTSFEGKLTYSIYAKDTARQKYIPTKTMVVFTNDTISRIENYSPQFGVQVLLKHLQLDKSILLLEANNNYYAIQTDLNKKDSANQAPKKAYTLKKKRGTVIIAGKKAHRLLVYYPESKVSFILYYFKHLSPNYIDAFTDAPGLPVRFEVESADGVLIYELVNLVTENVNNDLFGVPSNYKKVSFNQFLQEVFSNKPVQITK